jgi:hypothetical protein
MTNQIEATLWPGLHSMENKTRLGGIYAKKRGYHNKRKDLPKSDYSVSEFKIDREGPDDEGSAIDWTFPEAQKEHQPDYRTIARYSRRLMAAGKAKDQRTVYIREFFGNTDSDTDVEGWDFSKHRTSTSEKSHLWHIHISVHRKFIADKAAMIAILSILAGESYKDYQKRIGGPSQAHKEQAIVPPYPGTPLKQGMLSNPNVRKFQAQLKKRKWTIDDDGDFGKKTTDVVKAFQKQKKLKVTGIVDEKTWTAIWKAPVTPE